MAKLPDFQSQFQEQTYNTPQAARGGSSYQPSPVGAAVAGIGKEIGKVGQDIQEKQDTLDKTYASAHLLQGQADVLSKLQNEQDYTKIPQLYQEGMAKVSQEASGLLRNPSARAQFDAEASLHTMQSMTHVNNLANEKRKEYGKASSLENFNNLIDTASNTSDPALGTAMLKNANSIVDASVSTGFYTPEQGYDLKKKGAEKYGETWLESLTATDRLEYLTPNKAANSNTGGFDSAIQSVFKNEGGQVNIDGSSGAPAIYGINAKWHPEAYAQAKDATDSGGEAAGKQFATEFYKKEYWDKYNIGSLPADTQTIVMDGVVNHTPGFAHELVAAAKSGEPPEALIDMRKQEYQRLAEANPDKYAGSLQGWNNRLDTISGGNVNYPKTGTPVDFIPVEKRAELYKQTVAAAKSDIELRDSDPQTWAQVHGVTPNQPMDFTPKVLQDRAQSALLMNRDYGAPVKLFTNEEAKQFTVKMESQNTNQQLATLKTLRDNTGNPVIYQSALQQIRPDSPVTAIAGMYLGLDKQVTNTHWFKPDETVTGESVAQNLLDGEALLNPTKASQKENGVGKIFPMPSDGTSNQPGLRQSFNDYVGDAFRGQPQLADQAYQAFKAYYASQASKKGDYTGVLNSDISTPAAKAVLGAVVDSGSHKVIVPWGMDETTFNDLAKIRFGQLATVMGFDQRKVNYDNVSLENTGEQGKYRAVVGAGYLLDAGGKPLTITVR